jgi:tetratricopeptide (TPR) repeat protein
MLPPWLMMTTKKRRRLPRDCAVIAVAGALLTACGPPGARQLQQGEHLIQAGQYSEAVVVLTEAARTLADAPAPVQSKAWNLVGLACQGDGHPEAASEAFLRAWKLDRDNAAVDYNLGCLRAQQANYPAAIEYLTTYTNLRPRDARGYVRLGVARYHLALEQRTALEKGRQLEAARQHFEASEKLDATSEAANALGVIEFQRRPPTIQSVKAAMEDFERALRRDPRYAPALLNRAIVLQQYLNQPRLALKDYRQYLAINPPPPNAKAVEQLAHDLDVSLRITITPEHPPASAPPPAKITPAPVNVQPSRPKPPPTESPPAQTASPAPVPAPAPAPAPALAPAPTPPPKTPELSRPPVIVAPPAPVAPPPPETSTPVSTPELNPEPAPAQAASPPRKSFVQKLNPLRWFSGNPRTAKESAAGAEAEVEPPPVPPGSRYDFPPSVTPIPGDRAEARRLAAEGARARRAADFTQALRAYRDAVAADATCFDASLGLGLTEIDVRDYPAALTALHRALTLQEDSAEARYAFAWTLQKRGYTLDAVHELGRLVEQHPAEVRAHLLLGNLYAEKLGQTKLARDQYTQALALDTNNPEAPSVRAWLQRNP